EENAEATRSQILLQIAETYLGALQAQAVLRVAQQTVATRQLLLDQVSALASNTLRSDLDVSFARVSLEESRLLLSRAENNREAAFAALSALLGFREQHLFHLTEEPPLTGFPTNVSALVE